MALLAAFETVLSRWSGQRQSSSSARRSPTATCRDRAADRLVRQHARAAGRTSTGTRRSASCSHRVARLPRRLRPPGPSVREAGRGAAARAATPAAPAVPGDVRAPERADRRPRAARPRRIEPIELDRGTAQVRPHALRRGDGRGTRGTVRVRDRSVRRGDDRADGRPSSRRSCAGRGGPRARTRRSCDC